MKNPTANIAQLVIEASPSAQVTYDIAQQLVKELPLKSAAQFRERLGERGLKLAGSTIPAERILRFLPPNMFPIRDPKDLVTKVAAAVRVGVDIMTRAERFPEDRALMMLAREARPPEVSIGYFGGPSLFGGKRTQKSSKTKGA